VLDVSAPPDTGKNFAILITKMYHKPYISVIFQTLPASLDALSCLHKDFNP